MPAWESCSSIHATAASRQSDEDQRPTPYPVGTMGIVLYLILLAISGLILGGLARLALPGPDPMSIPMTIGIGIAGSFLGGLLMLLITGGRSVGGVLVAFAATVLLVYFVRRRRGGGGFAPGAESPRRRESRGY